MATVYRRAQLDAAIICGKSFEMDRVANRVKFNLIAEAAKHNLTSAFMNSIHTATVPGQSGNGRRVDDRAIYSTDPAALAINYGHIAWPKSGGYTIVPGKHVFEKVLGRHTK